MKLKRKKSGLIIIGDEILSGKTLEKNANFICKELVRRGIECSEISIIRDEEDQIIETVNSFRSKYDYVFTTGGIGPTHDDITSKSISKALKVKLTLNSEAKGRLEKHYSDDILTNARLKMAYIPENASLIDNPVSIAPGFAIKNIFVFPGVPEIFQIMFKDFIKSLAKQKKYCKRNVTTTLSEGIIGDFVEKVQNEFQDVEIGSYPYFKKNSFGVSLVIRGDLKKNVDTVSRKIFDYLQSKKGNPRLF